MSKPKAEGTIRWTTPTGTIVEVGDGKTHADVRFVKGDPPDRFWPYFDKDGFSPCLTVELVKELLIDLEASPDLGPQPEEPPVDA